jgi:drug/metabolite transporter (DMT)-like permease
LKNNTLLGIASIVLSMLIFSLQDIAVKGIGGNYPVLEIVIFRALMATPITLLLFWLEGGRGLPRSKNLFLENLRGFLLFLSYTTHFMGLAALPLAEIAAIKFSGPLMITALSVLILREKVQLRHWIALIIGFLGVIIIVRPGSASFNLGSFFILISTLLYAFSAIITRQLQKSDSSATMSYYSSVFYLIAAAILAPLAMMVGPMPDAPVSIAFVFNPWSMPSLLDLLIMLSFGLIWAGGMFLSARAYSYALASVIAPFEYVTLPINIMWGFLLWRELPSVMTVIGASITLASVLYTLYHDQRENFKAKAAES